MSNINIQDYLDPQLQSGKEEELEEIIDVEARPVEDWAYLLIPLGIILLVGVLCALPTAGLCAVIHAPLNCWVPW